MNPLENLKENYKKNKRRLFLCLDMSFLFVEIFYAYLSFPSDEQIVRTCLGGICLALWYILFPFLSDEEKNNISYKIIVHIVAMVFVVATLLAGANYILHHRERGIWYFEILCCIIGIVDFVILFYILSGFIKTFFLLIEKIRSFLFPKLKKETSGFVNFVERLTAMLISITGFVGAVIGFVEIITRIFESAV